MPDENVPQREMTYGEKAVGLTFNPSSDENVRNYKTMYAKLIDHLYSAKEASSDPEVKRQYSVAITELQTSQMWAVKAVTWGK